MSEKVTHGGRRPYLKPRIERVALVIEEAQSYTCKKGNSIGPGVQNCNPGNNACYKQNPS